MKYLRSFSIILLFTFSGELMHYLIPLPIPAAVYGIALMFGALCLKWIRPEQIRPCGNFLISIMPVLFVSPAVNLLDSWQEAKGNIIAILVLLLASTVLVFGISGAVTQFILRKGAKRHE